MGQVIDWVIVRFEDVSNMAQAAINTNAAILVKNVIASAIISLTNEKLISAHIYFLKEYHDSFLVYFEWMKHVDNETKKNSSFLDPENIRKGTLNKI